MRKYIIFIILLAVGVLSGMFIGRSMRPKSEVQIQRDTVTVRDTVTEYYPAEVGKEEKEVVKVAVTDTVRIRDTLYLNLQTEKKIYKGDDYYAEVSGYMASLDRIDVYPKTTTITVTQTVTQKPKSMAFSLYLGLDAGKASTQYITPNIGAEIDYKRWSLGVEAGADIGMINRVIQKPVLYLEGGFKYNLIKR